MAGITAVASSKTHAASGVDVAASGFIAGEEIRLTATPTGTDYLWAMSRPSGSNALRSAIGGDDEATAVFTPDAVGIYAITVDVDGTTYILRISVSALAQTNAIDVLRLTPVADSQVSAPAVGGALYWSSTQGRLALKDSAGDVFTVNLTAV